MAASSEDAIRVRLYFDYPPPGVPNYRMIWMLVDLNKCRVIADLCSVIGEKFEYSRQTLLDLFSENCFLHPAESIHVIRENDIIRVRVSNVSFEPVGKKRRRDDEGLIQTPTKKNRHEATETNCLSQLARITKKKKKHRSKKKKREGYQSEHGDCVKAVVSSKEPSSSKSQTEKSSNKVSASSHVGNGKVSENSSSDSSEEVPHNPSPKKSKSKHCRQVAPRKPKPTTCTSRTTPKGSTSSVLPKPTTISSAAKKTQSSADSSSSQNEPSSATRKANVPAKSSSVQQKSSTSITTAQTMDSASSDSSSSSSASKSSKVLQKSMSSSNKNVSTQQTSSKIGTPFKKPQTNPITSKPTSSDSSSSSEDEAYKASGPVTPKSLKRVPDLCATTENGVTPIFSTMLQHDRDQGECSDSSDTELVIKKPNPELMTGLTPRGRGRGFIDRTKGRGGDRGGFGRARGPHWKQNFHYSYDTEEQKQWKDIQTNKSFLLQNPPEPSPRKDYSSMPLLAAPPAVGQKIAFKLLELTENYTPEVSDYKEGKIISFNSSTKIIELELLTQTQARTEPGKFDLVYQDADGSERVEYAVTFGSQLTECWDSLLEPRLIVQNTD